MIEKKTIKQIKELINSKEIDALFIEQLEKDQRKGVQQLLTSYYRKREKEKLLTEKYIAMQTIEHTYKRQGKRLLAGVDEAGRGPLAGPVVAAAVILPDDFKLLGLTDSKQLSERKREEFYEIIKRKALSYSVAMVSNQEIDRVNIFEATKQAMYKAITSLDIKPDHVLIDAVQLDDLPYTYEAVIKGDEKSITIAAASILAKVTRDRYMLKMHEAYPMYEFASHMGYGTKEHLALLKEYGASPYHRTSFKPVANIMNR